MGQPNTPDECVYCGEVATELDHIPPKCLFGRPRPSNLATVPACRKCNRGASLDDQYAMRLALIDGTEVTKAARDVDEVFQRSIERPEAKGMRAEFMRSLSPVNLVTASGLYGGAGLCMDLKWERMTTLLNRLTRGFFWKLLNRRLPKGYTTDWHPVTTVPDISPEKAENQRIMTHLPYMEFGDGAFRLRCVPSPNDNNLTIFRFDFYLTQGFIGYTVRNDGSNKYTHLVLPPIPGQKTAPCNST